MKNRFEFNPNMYENGFFGNRYPEANSIPMDYNKNSNMPGINFNTSINGNMMGMNPHMNLPQNNVNHNLLPSNEGYTRGNLFANLYDPYKNFQPMKLIPTSEEAEMLLRANELTFASHELRLYLDIYPNDRNMIGLFNQYRHEANEAIKEYEMKYGPMKWNALSDANMFGWQADTWPWEMGVI